MREYIHETVHLRNTDARNRLLLKLSPSMQGEVSWLVNQKWISRIWYLQQHADTELLIGARAGVEAVASLPPLPALR